MIIHPAELVAKGAQVRIQSRFESIRGDDYLWYEVDKRYEQYLTTEKLDGFLVGLLLQAMKDGEDIRVMGAVSERLYFNLSTYYIKISRLLTPGLRKVSILPESLDFGDPCNCADGVVTGFSAGVDSFCAIYDHLISDPPPHYKITHFVFNNVGSHGQKDYAIARNLFHARYKLVKGFPEEMGFDFLKIDSNLNEILKLAFQKSHVSRNTSAILVLQKMFAKYYYASTHSYQDSYVRATPDIAHADPMTIHLLSTETLDCISTGCQYTRVEKTGRIAELDVARRWLNVCVRQSDDGKNCSTCWKCCRTLATLEMLGRVEEFDEVFDLDRWRWIRNKYFLQILSMRGNEFIDEIKEHARQSNYSFGPFLTIIASIPFSRKPLHFIYDTAAKR